MTAQSGRIAILAAVVVVAFTVGGAVGTVAAHDDHNDVDDESELAFHVAVTSSEASGQTTWDCSGTATDNGCDKNGSMDAGPVAIDYVGDNFFQPNEERGGGGDHFDVTVGNQTGEVGFDCEFTPAPEQPCQPEASGP